LNKELLSASDGVLTLVSGDGPVNMDFRKLERVLIYRMMPLDTTKT
jgi:hypothetical protein